MSCTISISRRDDYNTAGEYEATVYELLVEDSDGFVQDIRLQDESELLLLRNTLTSYIDNNLKKILKNEP